ncbi:DAK2 domain-containing protein [Sporosarcina sp. Marseille-Q4063]|uniref:DAK2 domain-containing protein n=1 Tax=Sporosarcina sp. Marseille-Q4063 TaxID=2810514 RepID=UPI001BB0C003|nr:DAK2 domain-containing protein [Sporosarcina sp. Marseille-Q4063]QUW21837.1 DAK2 domain-containing protein [Sporosarcina sp. Marseille-Q4063]
MKSIDGLKFAEMIKLGAHHLYLNADYVDSLNVFPVPDGDTGTNMNLSMTSGANEVAANAVPHIGETAGALSKGLLMGARGNSGVILSQLFRGFGKAIENEAFLDGKKFASALQYGVETAYKAVMKPVEGTILTVAKDAANVGVEVSKTTDDFIEVMEAVVRESKASLERTPDLLAVLKEVGVVDSGGQGLVYVYEGFLASLKGEGLPERTDEQAMKEMINEQHHLSLQGFMNTEDIIFGYCTEFMVKFEDEKLLNNPYDESNYREELSQFGDSLLVISDDDVAKVHIHSEEPGDVLSFSQKYGSLIDIKIENMREQHINLVGADHNVHNVKQSESIKHPYAIVTVAMGSGIAELLQSVGASAVIEGGQTMNPSTEDIVKAIEDISAERVLILPNNKNIIMAAEQAAEIIGIEAAVVPTKTVPEGLSAILAFNPEAEVSVNATAMTEAASHVKTAQVTHAVRDTTIDGLTIKKGEYMGIAEGKIVTTHASIEEVTKELLSKVVDDDAEIVTVLYGEEVTEDAASLIESYIEDNFDHVEAELYNGNQPLYPYIISVE